MRLNMEKMYTKGNGLSILITDRLNIRNMIKNKLTIKWLERINMGKIMEESGITNICEITLVESIDNNNNIIEISYIEDENFKSIKIDLEEALINILKEGK